MGFVMGGTVIPAKAGIQKQDMKWVPHQVRDDKNKIEPSIESGMKL
jgi:hypothetical protein